MRMTIQIRDLGGNNAEEKNTIAYFYFCCDKKKKSFNNLLIISIAARDFDCIIRCGREWMEIAMQVSYKPRGLSWNYFAFEKLIGSAVRTI